VTERRKLLKKVGEKDCNGKWKKATLNVVLYNKKDHISNPGSNEGHNGMFSHGLPQP
jgi:hypothetical protein